MADSSKQQPSNDETTIPVFVPALVVVLQQAENAKGEPLTKAEVSKIRDEAACVNMTPDDAAKLQESRGFRDIDPASVWHEWQQLRVETIQIDDAQAAD